MFVAGTGSSNEAYALLRGGANPDSMSLPNLAKADDIAIQSGNPKIAEDIRSYRQALKQKELQPIPKETGRTEWTRKVLITDVKRNPIR